MTLAWEKEVEDIHLFYQNWFEGKVEDSQEEFDRFEKSLSDEFTIITPGGLRVNREDTIRSIRSQHGQFEYMRIATEEAAVQYETADTLVVSFNERHDDGDTITNRAVTVVFAKDETQPNGVKWVHLHETWLTV